MEQFERLEKILDKFGDRLKYVKIYLSKPSGEVKLTEVQAATILKLIPNVEKLIFMHIWIRNYDSNQHLLGSQTLNLYNMQLLVCIDCLFESVVLFNMIPPRTINELVLLPRSNPVDGGASYQAFFDRQTTIKRLTLFEFTEINIDHLELDWLRIQSERDYTHILKHQPKIKHVDFAASSITDEVFREVCKLEELESLTTDVCFVSMDVFRKLQNKHLKELRFDCAEANEFIDELSIMKINNVEKLTLGVNDAPIPDYCIVMMALSLRKVKSIQVINKSLSVIGSFLTWFEHLNSFHAEFSGSLHESDVKLLEMPANFHHHKNLRQLVLTGMRAEDKENTNAVLKLVKDCPNLERIRLSTLGLIPCNKMEEMISSRPNLTHLSINCEYNFRYMTVEKIRQAKNLRYLKLEGGGEYPKFFMFNKKFAHQFGHISFKEPKEFYYQLIMRKANEKGHVELEKSLCDRWEQF